MIIEAAVSVIAVAFVVLVVYLVSTLLRVREAIVELQRLLLHLNSELPSVIKEIRRTTEHLNALAEQARDGIEHASVLLHAVGEVGETVHQVHALVRGRSGYLLTKLIGVVAGVKAAASVVKERLSKPRKEADGGI